LVGELANEPDYESALAVL